MRRARELGGRSFALGDDRAGVGDCSGHPCDGTRRAQHWLRRACVMRAARWSMCTEETSREVGASQGASGHEAVCTARARGRGRLCRAREGEDGSAMAAAGAAALREKGEARALGAAFDPGGAGQVVRVRGEGRRERRLCTGACSDRELVERRGSRTGVGGGVAHGRREREGAPGRWGERRRRPRAHGSGREKEGPKVAWSGPKEEKGWARLEWAWPRKRNGLSPKEKGSPT